MTCNCNTAYSKVYKARYVNLKAFTKINNKKINYILVVFKKLRFILLIDIVFLFKYPFHSEKNIFDYSKCCIWKLACHPTVYGTLNCDFGLIISWTENDVKAFNSWKTRHLRYITTKEQCISYLDLLRYSSHYIHMSNIFITIRWCFILQLCGSLSCYNFPFTCINRS